MTLYEELTARGLIAQVTDEQEIKDLVNNGKAVFYIGFDPTARRTLYGSVSYETSPDGWQQADRSDWRRYRNDWRSIRTYRYASDDDTRNYSA